MSSRKLVFFFCFVIRPKFLNYISLLHGLEIIVYHIAGFLVLPTGHK